MVGDFFSVLLQELGEILQIKDLAPDDNNSCLLKLKNGISVQLEPAKKDGFIVMGAKIASIPPGRYRENIFREALKANGLPPPQQGIFAFSKNNDQLVLFEMISLQDLSGAKLNDHLVPFSEKVKTWQDAISRGDIPPVGTATAGSRPKGIFGL